MLVVEKIGIFAEKAKHVRLDHKKSCLHSEITVRYSGVVKDNGKQQS